MVYRRLLISCKEELLIQGFNADTGLSLSIRDSAGNDLLDSTQIGAIDKSKIRLYYVNEQNQMVEYFQGNLIHQRGYVFSAAYQERPVNLNTFFLM